jgi:hypothetical protein
MALLVGIASVAAPNTADAHNVDSTWAMPSPGSFFFFHTAPDVGVFTYVGYTSSGTLSQDTRSQNASSITAYIRAQVQCWSGAYRGSYGWVGSNGWKYSGSCTAIGSTAGAGRVSINM